MTRMPDTPAPHFQTPDALSPAPTACVTVSPPEMAARAGEAAALLKTLAHEGRLMILCHLATGERSVTELEQALGSRQAAVSQQLARLRSEGLVDCRRDGKAIYYALRDQRAGALVQAVHGLFCAAERPAF